MTGSVEQLKRDLLEKAQKQAAKDGHPDARMELEVGFAAHRIELFELRNERGAVLETRRPPLNARNLRRWLVGAALKYQTMPLYVFRDYGNGRKDEKYAARLVPNV